MSCKPFLKSQVGIISLGAFQVFCEARANTRSPRSNGFTTAEIDRKQCSKTSDESVSVPGSRILEISQRVKAIGRFIRAVSAYDQYSSD